MKTLLLIALAAALLGLVTAMAIIFNLTCTKISFVYANGKWEKLETGEQSLL